MAFFKFRKADGDAAPSAAQTESVEVLRKRARHRLIGAAVLVLVGVIGFPLLFDTQPRPVAVDIPIDIPDRNKVKPLALPAPPASSAVASGQVSAPAPAAAPAPSAAKPAVAESLGPREEVVPSASGQVSEKKVAVVPAPSAPPAIKNEAKSEPPAAPKVEPKHESKTAVKADDGARAKALLEGKTPVAASAAADSGRYVVQVGAFADNAKARETRLKVERAGLKTYTQVVDTKDGKRIRVRVGPFGSKSEADRAASKIKGLDLPAAILTL
ncbi:MAG: SPOR domain-containing protein [Ramlibacter sp.]|nr:SPOR domain-containing protein [Ramlibacter sp.]